MSLSLPFEPGKLYEVWFGDRNRNRLSCTMNGRLHSLVPRTWVMFLRYTEHPKTNAEAAEFLTPAGELVRIYDHEWENLARVF